MLLRLRLGYTYGITQRVRIYTFSCVVRVPVRRTTSSAVKHRIKKNEHDHRLFGWPILGSTKLAYDTYRGPPPKNPGVRDALRPHRPFFCLARHGSDDGSWNDRRGRCASRARCHPAQSSPNTPMRGDCARGDPTARRPSEFTLLQSGGRRRGRQQNRRCCARPRSSARAAPTVLAGA
jgi:hypothetical protein